MQNNVSINHFMKEPRKSLKALLITLKQMCILKFKWHHYPYEGTLDDNESKFVLKKKTNANIMVTKKTILKSRFQLLYLVPPL
jgi:hypothetical protein